MSKYTPHIIGIFLLWSLSSCDFFKKQQAEEIVARVNDHNLTNAELKRAFKRAKPQDSALFAQTFINEWATTKLLIDGAMRNLEVSKRDDFEELVDKYRSDLYTKYYKDALVQKRLNTTVSNQEAAEFYATNRQNFRLNEELLQFRFIQVSEDYKNLNELKKIFTRFNDRDRYALDSLQFQFKGQFLNDSTWVKRSLVQQQINPINPENADKLLKKTNFLQLRDSLGLYLIAIKNTLERNDIAPLEYVRPTINQIIENRRKLELVKQLEKEIKDDAIKNKQFEIYN